MLIQHAKCDINYIQFNNDRKKIKKMRKETL